MKTFALAILLLFTCPFLCAQKTGQVPQTIRAGGVKTTTQKKALKTRNTDTKKELVNAETGKADYKLYKVISHHKDTVLVDTTLTLQKYYKTNYLRKDLFGFQEFHNQGQVLSPLTFTTSNQGILPKMGALGKHSAYKEIEDIHYYKVPTPISEFFYYKGLKQGQTFDSKLAINTSENFNFSLEYTGLRSLGTYRNALSSIKSFRGTVSYTSKNKRYSLRAHLANQNIFNQENGGLTVIGKGFFETKNPEYEDRGRLDVNLEDANTSLIGKRYYIDHNFKLLNNKDSLSSKLTNLQLGHVLNYETKNYYFRSSATDFFGNTFTATTDDKTSHKAMNNEVYLNFTSPYVLGNFRVKAGIHNLYQGYKKIVNLGEVTIPNQIEQQATSFGAQWKAVLKNIHFNAEATSMLQGDIEGSNLFVEASFIKNKKITISSSVQLNSKAPALNYSFYQSNFAAYNWVNDFKNIQTRNLNIGIKSKWLNANAVLKSIDNFTYFNDATQSSPSQYGGTITAFKAQAQREFKLGNLALNTDIIYQKVTAGSSVFKQPDFVGRSTFYFSKYLFKKRSMFLQTGVTANYFSAYEANTYNPVLGEFTLQNTEIVGGKPILDLFINAEIRRTRVYFNFENLLAFSNSNYYYATPNNPYRDFVFRFGFVWNFFR